MIASLANSDGGWAATRSIKLQASCTGRRTFAHGSLNHRSTHMALGNEVAAIADLLTSMGVTQGDLTAAELDLSGDLQLVDVHAFHSLVSHDAIVGRLPTDPTPTAILSNPPAPVTIAQVVV